MLYRVTVENFGAIRDRQILDLTISGKVEVEENRQLTGPYQIRVPHVSVILGANASGKTTALRAIGYLADFATRSALYPQDSPLFFHPFWDEVSQNASTTISVEFIADWITPGVLVPFRYTFTAKSMGKHAERGVDRELLEVRSSAQWSTLIDRQGSTVSFRRQMSRLGGAVPQTALARTNVSVIALLGQFVVHNSIVNAMRKSLEKVVTNFNFWFKGNRSPEEIADLFHKDKAALKALNSLIRKADLGIMGVRAQEFQSAANPDQKQHLLMFEHAGLTRNLSHSFESHGTMNFVILFPILYKALATGGIALMDELDSDLHPELLKEVAGWFNDPDINEQGAQLIMTCNNPAILDSLRKEEVFFAVKDASGRTSLYALKEIPGIRRSANFQRDYLAGRYGALPNIG